jgi:hypothetical protein
MVYLMKLTAIEVVFEECGWTYDPEKMSWRLENFRVSRVNLHKAIEQGKGAMLRQQIIDKLTPSDQIPTIAATIERLKTSKSK